MMCLRLYGRHPSVPLSLRGEPTAPVEFQYNNEIGPAVPYDGLRVDIWGPGAQEHLSPFVLSFMRWLRHVSGQPWISDIDVHSQSVLKRFFEIDARGAAMTEAYPFGSLIGSPPFKFVTNALWSQAFLLAASGLEVPVFSNLYFDAVNGGARRDYARAIMNLAMALESCRDHNFARIHPSTTVQGRGPQLDPPFDHTDLLKHLSSDAAKAFGRDFSQEHAAEWQEIRNLYIARHHVAHGKKPVFTTNAGLKTVDKDTFSPMLLAAGLALNWMERL
jgi:hypothetical protein